MTDARPTLPLPRSNEELLELCDYATGEDMHVELTMADILRLRITIFHTDPSTRTPWMQVSELRDAVNHSISEEIRLKKLMAGP